MCLNIDVIIAVAHPKMMNGQMDNQPWKTQMYVLIVQEMQNDCGQYLVYANFSFLRLANNYYKRCLVLVQVAWTFLGYITGRDETQSYVFPQILEEDRLRDTRSTNLSRDPIRLFALISRARWDPGSSDRPVWCNGKIPPMVYPRSLGHFRMILSYKRQAPSSKLQAPSSVDNGSRIL